MVAPKRGRGAKAQAAAKAKPAEEPAQEDVTEAPEAMEDNGQAEGAEQGGQAEAAAEGADNAEGSKDGDGELKPDEKKEEKVESGKLLVENLPSSYLFDYQEKLKELFSKHGEVASVKRGPIIVTELTTTPTLSAIVEFKNKDSLEKALAEEGTVLDGSAITVAVESRADTAVLVGVPYEASTDYVRLLFAQCGEVAHIHEFSKTKYKILRVTFHEKEAVEKALKLDRELRINGFMVTVSKYRDEDEQKQHTQHVNKVQQEMRKSRSGTFPVYFTSEIIRDIEAKAEYHRLWKRQRDDATYETFKMLRAKVKAAIDEARSNYEKQHSTNDEAAEPAADNPDTQFATDSYDTQFSIDNYAQFSGDGHDSQFAMDSFEGQLFSGSQNKRQHPQNQNRNQPNVNANANANSTPPNRANNFPRPRGAAAFNARGNFRGARGRGGFGGRGGAFPRGGFAPVNAYMPPQAFMGRPGGFMNDGQRPNKRLRM